MFAYGRPPLIPRSHSDCWPCPPWYNSSPRSQRWRTQKWPQQKMKPEKIWPVGWLLQICWFRGTVRGSLGFPQMRVRRSCYTFMRHLPKTMGFLVVHKVWTLPIRHDHLRLLLDSSWQTDIYVYDILCCLPNPTATYRCQLLEALNGPCKLLTIRGLWSPWSAQHSQ